MLKHQKVLKYYENDCRPRHGHKYTKYKLCLSLVMAICLKQVTFDAQLMKKLSSTESELKNALLIKKPCFALNLSDGR